MVMMNAEYERRFNEYIPGQAGPTFISTMLAYSAIEKSGSLDGTVLRDTLRTMNEDNTDWFKVTIGRGGFDQSQGNRNVGADAVILQWQNGRPMAVYPPDQAAVPLLNPATMRPFGQ
jgi:branched-chain amino acid transport system substrate-binding protein